MDQYFDNYKRQLNLLLDKNRTLKYKYAIFKAVKPDDIVIDFGSGTGILGFFALQAGAQHVYAIEETSIIDFAQRLAIKNEIEDKITFIKKPGLEVTEKDIPEKADIIISEPVSNLLMEGNAWSTIEYLKKFLHPEASILPTSGSLFIVPVNAAPIVFQDSEQLIGNPNVYNVDFLALPRYLFYKSTLRQEYWISKPQPILEVQLARDKLSDTLHNSVKFSIQQTGKLYGIEFFFKLNIFGNIMLSSRDEVGYRNWSPLFAPCSQQNLVSPGDELRVTVFNEILGPYKALWTLEFEHHSRRIPYNDVWWDSEKAIPKIAPGVVLTKTGCMHLKRDEYFQYDFDTEIELDFIELLPKSLNCTELCQIIHQSGKYDYTYAEVRANLIKLLDNLMRNSLIQLGIPRERYQVIQHRSIIHIP